jgi:ATP-dependent DNA ligase
VDLALARPADTVLEDTACPGGCRYELKFDGFRVAFRSGTVLDGEAVVWVDGRLSFDHLHQRFARRCVPRWPGGTAG